MEAINTAEHGENIERKTLHLRVNGQDLYVEDYCKIIQAVDGHVIGFVGCMVDITKDFETKQHEKELQKRVKELTFDIGRILHANTTTLVMVKQTLDAVIEAFEPKPYQDSVPSVDEVETTLSDFSNALASTIERFAQCAEEERRFKALPPASWNKLIGYINFLREFKSRIPTPESYPATLRKIANDVGQIHSNIVPGFIPREPTRELQNAAWHLERVTNLIEVLNTRAAVIQMDYTIHSLREFVTSDVREPIEQKNISVKVLIEECTKRLAEYARSLKIDIDRKEVDDIYIRANEREMVRAFSNLMHNAIKYSWRRDPERAKPAWVSVSTKIKDQRVYVEFENWGVPIKREEIEKDKVFELGYRGELSKDRGRLGTGIGLTDARLVAESHNGHIEIESHPAVRGSHNEKQDNYYEQPFLTKVTMVLPLSKKL
jgi:signal transduction histidine kinase